MNHFRNSFSYRSLSVQPVSLGFNQFQPVLLLNFHHLQSNHSLFTLNRPIEHPKWGLTITILDLNNMIILLRSLSSRCIRSDFHLQFHDSQFHSDKHRLAIRALRSSITYDRSSTIVFDLRSYINNRKWPQRLIIRNITIILPKTRLTFSNSRSLQW